MTGQYYLRSRYYNPVIARFTQEDTYYGDGLNLYIYCQNNPILNHDPTGHGTKENSPYSRKEQQYIDAGADPDTAKLETQCYPDAKSKQDLYNKYKSQGYNATDAKKLANYEIVHGEERAKNYAANNVKKSGPDYTPTSPRDNVNTDWRTQNRLNAQKKAGAGKSGSSSGKYQVGAYQDIKGVEGLDAHHVGQKALMKKLVADYDELTAPAINVPKLGHTKRHPERGIVSRSTKGITNARQLLARDLFELKRVYPDIPNSALKELIDMNKKMYPEMRK